MILELRKDCERIILSQAIHSVPLENGLNWKRNKLERRVLTPATDCIRNGTRSKCQRWSGGKQSSVFDPNDYQCHYNSKKSIRKYTECCTWEFSIWYSRSRLELSRHDQFLHVSPCQIRCLQASETHEESECLLEEIRIRREIGGEKRIEVGNLSWGRGRPRLNEQWLKVSMGCKAGWGRKRIRSTNRAAHSYFLLFLLISSLLLSARVKFHFGGWVG